MMLDFHEPRIEDRAWVNALTRSVLRENCEYCFGNIFIWSPVYRTYIARFADFFMAAGMEEDGAYCFPVGQGDLRRAIDALHDDAAARGRELRLFGITDADRRQLEEAYPGRFEYTEDRDFFDYIYLREDLATLPGKKYHAKRNHIAAFVRDNDYTYERITPAVLPDCLAIAELWMERNREKNPVELANERFALGRAFDHFEALQLQGALLRCGGEVVAFTVGEPISDTLFCTHFEKAFSEIRGAYAMINREFAARDLCQYTYINREEDTGDEGLRAAKLRYHPVKLLQKYDAVCKD